MKTILAFLLIPTICFGQIFITPKAGSGGGGSASFSTITGAARDNISLNGELNSLTPITLTFPGGQYFQADGGSGDIFLFGNLTIPGGTLTSNNPIAADITGNSNSTSSWTWGGGSGSSASQTDVIGIDPSTGIVTATAGNGIFFTSNLGQGNLNLLSIDGATSAVFGLDNGNGVGAFIEFPAISSAEQVAYQSWVTSQGYLTTSGNGSSLTGITAAQVGAISNDSGSITTNGGGALTVATINGDGSNLTGTLASMNVPWAQITGATPGNNGQLFYHSGAALTDNVSDWLHYADGSLLTDNTGDLVSNLTAGQALISGGTNNPATGAFVLKAGASQNAQLTGTAYTITTSYATVTGGTTSPTITFSASGDFYIYADISTNITTATFAAVQEISAKVRRTNNTAADIGTPRSQIIPIVTTFSGAGPSIAIVAIPYTATSGDVISIQALLTSGSGITVNNATLVAVPR